MRPTLAVGIAALLQVRLPFKHLGWCKAHGIVGQPTTRFPTKPPSKDGLKCFVRKHAVSGNAAQRAPVLASEKRKLSRTGGLDSRCYDVRRMAQTRRWRKTCLVSISHWLFSAR